MAIAGVKSLNQVKTKYVYPMSGEPLVVNDMAAGEYYDREKMREILIKFSNEYILFIDDDTVEEIVDEFMESDS
ncbi:hypothetical protein WC27P1_00024 [Weissella phage WC27P1]|nr:hypothetical protein WC27P1_00024 [Weissella phage WC27P1]